MPSEGGQGRIVHVVLPAYNEEANMDAVLEALSRTRADTGLRIRAIVVDDGSTDGTVEVALGRADSLPVTIIRHGRNLGLGATIRDGLLKAVDMAASGDLIVTMDADDTHAPAAILSMVSAVEDGFDVVIASRYRHGSRSVGVPWTRRVLSRAASWLCTLLFPIDGVRDFTCGYRGYRAEVLSKAVQRFRQEFINQEGFQCMVDILLKLNRMGLRFVEIPLVLRYDRKGGKSKMRMASTAYRTLLLLLRRWWEYRD